MAKQLNELMNEIENISVSIRQILYHTGYEPDCELNVTYDRDDAEQLFLLDELYQILGKLHAVSVSVKYLNRPVVCEGHLSKNQNDRYEINGYELTSGCGLEYLSTDGMHSYPDENGEDWVCPSYWCSSRLEHNGEDYYIVGAPGLVLEGLKVRIRR